MCGIREGKYFFLYPSEFLAETHVIKDRIRREKQTFIKMYTSFIRGRYAGKKETLSEGPIQSSIPSE